MVFVPSLLLLTALSSVGAYPLNKRIAQTISDSTKKWEAACDAAGGGQQCNTIVVNAFGTLLAAAGPCDQQNAADGMIDLAKTLKNDPDMIKFAQIFAQQPRNSPTSLSVPYCGSAPKNSELNGLFQCQFASTNPTTFVGNVKVGDNGTIPFGHSGPVSPPGSCPASPSGPVPDGQQLSDITQDPGAGGSASNSTGSASSAAPAPASTSDASSAAPVSVASSDVASPTGAAGTVSASAPAATPSDDSGDGDDGCDDGDDGDDESSSAAVAAPTPSAGMPSSAVTAMPTATASGSDVNNGGAAPSMTMPAAAPSATGSASGNSSSSDFHVQNGQDAQKLNAQFAGMTANDSCDEGAQACVPSSAGGAPAFAQCVGGKWALSACAGGTQCFALPLVNKPGTSLACTTLSDAQARIAASGATGGVDGKGN